jgi:tetratricopeptide (TPR) repeat protein
LAGSEADEVKINAVQWRDFRGEVEMTKSRIRIEIVISLGCFVFVVAAAPYADPTPEELIRQANAAFLRGDIDEADRLYATAEEATTDPGLVAFNRAAVLFQKGAFREAELEYDRVLEDRARPPERAAKAWYNRGTCLLRRGGPAVVYRYAIRDFEQCLDSVAADEPLKADARYNLELAKILWNEARKTASKPDSPNENPPPEDLQNNPPPNTSANDQQPGMPDPGDGNNSGGNTRSSGQQSLTPSPGAKSSMSPTPTPGNAPNLQPLQDSNTLQPLTPEDTREHLKRTAERLKRDRQNLRNTLYGPERFGHIDW